MSRLIDNIIVFLFLPLATSCVEYIVMDPCEEMPVVVNCVLTTDEVQTLDLYRAKRPSESGYASIADASVIVSGNGQSYAFTWNGENWVSGFVPEYGTRYDLSITLSDGKTIHSHTVLPERMSIMRVPIYSGLYTSIAGYNIVNGCSDEAFIWITPTAKSSDRICNFCTDHPGADHSNVVNGTWEDLPAAGAIASDYNSGKSTVKTDPECWQMFRTACSALPMHRNYLRIHHKATLDSPSAPHLVVNSSGGKMELENSFILDADQIDSYYPSGWSGVTYRLPVRTYFLSKEYDEYLSSVVKAGLHKDELASMYSMDLNYSNIEGGIGIFGAMYYHE